MTKFNKFVLWFVVGVIMIICACVHVFNVQTTSGMTVNLILLIVGVALLVLSVKSAVKYKLKSKK